MSDRVIDDIGSAAPGHYGAEGTGVVLAEVPITAAWNVHGDPASGSFVAGIERLFAVALPLIPNATRRSKALTALWLGPRSWLLVGNSPSPSARPLLDFESHSDAVNALGGALFDVSAARVAYRIGGAHAAMVLAKNCPLDFHPDTFPAGGCAQSVLGHINALFLHEDAATYLVLIARSLATDAWQLVCRSSAQYGYEVAKVG